MSGQIVTVDEIFKNLIVSSLQVKKHFYGLTAIVYEPVSSNYSRVYGNFEGTNVSTTGIQMEILVPSGILEEPYMGVDDLGLFDEVFIYSEPTVEIKPGSIIVITRDDGREFRFRVKDRKGLGITQTVLYRYLVIQVDK